MFPIPKYRFFLRVHFTENVSTHVDRVDVLSEIALHWLISFHLPSLFPPRMRANEIADTF
jgi:hypothetical protein